MFLNHDLVGQTTCIFNRFDHAILDANLTGKEIFPVKGGLMDGRTILIGAIMHSLSGLNVFYDCNKKAQIVLHWIRQFVDPQAITVIGSMAIDSWDKKSQFGFEFDPPFEFHAWVELSDKLGIVDFSLPGVIILGSNTKDQYGPVLTGRNPFILAGPAPDFLHYKPYLRLDVMP